MIEFMSVIALILFLLVGYIVVIRVAKPHSKRMGRNGAQPGAPAVGARAPAASAAAPKGRFGWIAEYLWTILLVVVGLVVFFQGIYSSEWKTPSFSAVGSWSWGHWLQLLVLWGIGSALLALNKEKLGAAVSALQSLFTGIAVMAFLVCPVIGWFEGSSSAPKPQTVKKPVVECSKVHHCVLHEQDDGSTERVSVPKGKALCLDGSSWDNRDKLGLRSTYQGGAEVAHTCSKGQVISGTCREPNLDSFRFVPKGEVRIPRYWFVPEGTEC